MKIAITSVGTTLEDQIDERFGRAKYFLVLDSLTGDVEVVDNSENCAATQGAGINSVQIIADRGAEYLITGFVGPKALEALKKAKIPSFEGVDSSLTCWEALKKFKTDTKAEVPCLKLKGSKNMSEKSTIKLAIPSEQPGGLEANRSGHFGRCALFTLVELKENEIVNVSIIENPPHAENGCLRPVSLLAEQNVNAILVNGIGGRPLSGFNSVGIKVYLGNGLTVKDCVKAYLKGNLTTMSMDDTCRGH